VSKMTDRELDTLHKTVADGIVKLRQQSEIGTGGRARSSSMLWRCT
jgi:hypothetical protein